MTDTTNETQPADVDPGAAAAEAPPVDIPADVDQDDAAAYDEHQDDDGEGPSGIPAGHLAAGGATTGTILLGLLYQLTGVPGLVAGGVAAGGGVVAYVRHRRSNASGTGWGRGSDRSRITTASRSLGTSSGGSLFGGGKARKSSGGLFGSGSGSRAAGRSSGLLGGASTGRAGRTAAGQGSAGTSTSGGKRGRGAVGTDAAHGSAGPVRRGARAFGRFAGATRRSVGRVGEATSRTVEATGRGIGRATLAAGRTARRARTWVNERTGGRAGHAARAAGARKAAVWADRATGRRVSTAYRAATTGKVASFRARRRRAAAILGWHGPLTGPVVALVAVLAGAWRRRKARKAKAAEAEGAEEASTGSEATSQETPADEAATGRSQVIDEPTTATCPRCGRTHTVTLTADEDERVVTCPCGHRIRFHRDPGAFDPPDDPATTKTTADTGPRHRRPSTTSTPYTRRSRTMSAFPLAAIAAEMNAAAAAHTPADMWQVARELDQLPEVPANVGMSVRTYTERMQGDYPVHPMVVEAMAEFYMDHARLVEKAQEISALFRRLHAEDLKREEAPRTNEAAWNV
ncbi:hypothetical protein [Microbispora triticiradicis]|uniref:DUF4129 domain-containing protein n=2 Tax=Microbispora TaxID=2005 RepID=A0ABY3LQB3_9ACTN|nr:MULTISPECIES: hypothetical protein [Microbispora]TLP66523.1 hypothetical protein FED44_03420 [Microbispora fusca]TYB47416.1 hypothetical protein FXF59_29820 [Microbispora tritici]